ncbi:MAG: protein translocase subunit SecD [Planctomycetota bacterium]|nr:protein translocase subunit SecD [Planctomycetota bacterium]
MTDVSQLFLSIPAAAASLIAQANAAEAVTDAAGEAAQATGASGWVLFIAFLLIIGLPFLLGWAIAKALRLPDTATRIGIVLLAAFIGTAPFVWNVVVGTTQEGLTASESLRRSIKLGVDLAGGTNLVFQVIETPDKPLTGEVLDNMVGSITKRINPGGTEEVTVRRVGRDRIEIIVPGADPEKVSRIKRRIVQLGSLEFDLLANRTDHQSLIDQARALSGSTRDIRQSGRIVASWKSVARDPEGAWKLEGAAAERYVNRQKEILSQPPNGSPEGIDKQVLVVLDRPERRVTGEYLRAAAPTRDESGQPAVSFTFNSKGGSLFSRLTSDNLPSANGFQRQLAILLDDKIHSAPTISETISTSGIIHGRFTQDEVRELVSVLSAGALEVPLDPEPVSEFTISPLLGEDTVRKAVTAIIWAGIAVFIITAAYYLLAGLVADFCLVLNLVLLLGVMSFIDATFTLPGLAGVVLTIGMAVDANVLIFERMREEFERGSSMRLAIQNGFDRAFSAIIDSNVTTLITAMILFIIGTDAVRGFAVSLFIGIVVSMFTALYVSRLIFEIMERKRWVRKLQMNSAFSRPQINWLGKKTAFISMSVVLIALGVGMLAYRGARMLDIDFLGGTMVTFQLEEPTTSAKVREALNDVPEFQGNVSVERLVLAGEERGEVGQLFRVRTTMRDRATAAEQAEADRRGVDPTDQKPVSRLISDAFEEAGLEIRRVTIDYGPVEPIEGTPSEESFAGGHQTELTLGTSRDGEQQELNADTIAASLADRLAELERAGQPRYDEPLELLRVTGTAGSGSDSADDEAKSFSRMRVEASSAVSQADFEAALSDLKSYMASEPVFDEVNSFDSSVAGETQQSALMAIFASWLAIIGYLWFRFQDISYGFAAVICLVHDVLITLGFLALASYIAGPLGITVLGLEEFKINLPMVAAVLTLIGYSINDTIVVFDRIREVRGKNPALTEGIVNSSLNQTLSRTLLTSVTTLIVTIVLYFFGGEGIHGFTFILTVGILVGTYSSIYIAAPALLWLTNRKAGRPVAARPVRQPLAT